MPRQTHLNNLDEVYLSKHMSASLALQVVHRRLGQLWVLNWLVMESRASTYWDEGLTTYYCLRVKPRLQAQGTGCGLGAVGLQGV